MTHTIYYYTVYMLMHIIVLCNYDKEKKFQKKEYLFYNSYVLSSNNKIKYPS